MLVFPRLVRVDGLVWPRHQCFIKILWKYWGVLRFLYADCVLHFLWAWFCTCLGFVFEFFSFLARCIVVSQAWLWLIDFIRTCLLYFHPYPFWNFICGLTTLANITSVETSTPGHWYLQQSNVNPKLLCQRHLWKSCQRSFQTRLLQQKINHLVSGNSNCCPTYPSWRTCQARRLRRNKGSY